MNTWAGHVRAVLYGIQFEKNPLDGLDRVMHQVVQACALSATPEQYLASIQVALAGETSLAALIPQPHSEETVREYLRALERRIIASCQSE